MTGELARRVRNVGRARRRDETRARQRRTFIALLENGSIGTMQSSVYDHVSRNRGAICSEIAAALRKHPNEIMPRLLELERDGHLHRGSARRSRVTKVESTTWYATTPPAARQLLIEGFP